MKRVEGYLTDDKTFFDNEAEAEFYEAKAVLERFLSAMGVRAAAVFEIINKLEPELERYINAKRLLDLYQSEYKGPKEYDVPLFELQVRGNEPMPDMGNDLSTEEVRIHKQIDGIGSWRDDASSVRGGEDMATGEHPGSAETRSSSSE